MKEKLMRCGEVAEILHVSPSFVYKLIQRGEIASIRFGNAIRVRREDLERYIDDRWVKIDKKNKG